MTVKHFFLLSMLTGLQFTAGAQHFQWGKSILGDATTEVFPKKSCVAPSGNAVFHAGIFNDSENGGSVNFDPEVSNLTISDANHAVFITKRTTAGQFSWVRAFSSSTGLTDLSGLAVDNDGNSYLYGHFNGNLDSDPGTGVRILSTTTIEYFLIKLDSNGDFVWAQQFGLHSGNPGSIYVRGNALFCAGVYTAASDFDNSPDVHQLTPSDAGDIFVLKLNTEGVFQWVTSIGANNSSASEIEQVMDIAAGASGEVVVSGAFSKAGDFNPGTGESILTPTGTDAFLLKLDGNGIFQWAVSSGNANNEAGNSVGIAADGSVYQSGTSITTALPITVSTFITRYSGTGTQVWSHELSGSNTTDASVDVSDLTTDEAGAVYISGSFDAPEVDFDPGTAEHNLSSSEFNSYMLKLTAAGELAWVASFPSSNPNSLSGVDYRSGMLYGSGVFYNTLDLDPGSEVHEATGNSGYADGFFIKLDTAAVVLGVNEATPVPFQLYPNPTASSAKLQLEQITAGSSVTVFNLQGAIVSEQQLKALTTEIDLGQLPTGTYLVEVQQNGAKNTQRLVKH